MKKLLCILCMFSLLLTLCAGALADDVIELEYLNHKPEASAIDAMQDCPVGAIVLLPASPSCP